MWSIRAFARQDSSIKKIRDFIFDIISFPETKVHYIVNDYRIEKSD